MMAGVYVALLLLSAFALTCVIPRALPRWRALRLQPSAGVVLWQSVAIAGVIASLMAGPLAVLSLLPERGGLPRPSEHLVLLTVGAAVSAFVLARLLLQGHVVGSRLRRSRRAHVELLDVLSRHEHQPIPQVESRQLRVLDNPVPTAYCVPGRHNERLVLSEGAIDQLRPEELAAVIAHERAHLSQRHDLVVEFFTVMHTAVPEPVRSGAGMTEVRLLVERVADRAAVRATGPVPLARALVTLASSTAPDAAMGATPSVEPARVRLLAETSPHRAVAIGAYLAAATALALPLALTAGALLTRVG